MADNITVVEVAMEPSKVAAIVDRWAAETEFAVHERTEKRALYRYDRHISTVSWLSIENLGTKARLSAWLAPKGMDPDTKGSFWKGNKVTFPPVGIAMGPLGRFRKQFNALSDIIKNETNDPLVVEAANGPHQIPITKNSLAKFLIWVGVIVLLYGVLNLYNGTNSMTRQLFPDMAEEFVRDGLVNIFLGVVFLICSILLKKGKALSIWLYGASMLLPIGFAFAQKADFPFFPILFGVLITSQLLGLKKQGQLA